MDMTIAIREDRIITSLYEKYMNLYLYIPSHSAHPPGVLTRLVPGNILQIHLLCSKQDDINRHMKEFCAWLLVRRYQRDFLIPAFSMGIIGACAFVKRGSVRQCVSYQGKDTQGRVFFHLMYHPRDPTSKSLQRQCRQHLLHPTWETPLWRLKTNTKSQLVSNQCAWPTDAPRISATSSHTARLTISMGPWSPPIWSRYWGPFLSLNQ